jgi:hypothetical protein
MTDTIGSTTSGTLRIVARTQDAPPPRARKPTYVARRHARCPVDVSFAFPQARDRACGIALAVPRAMIRPLSYIVLALLFTSCCIPAGEREQAAPPAPARAAPVVPAPPPPPPLPPGWTAQVDEGVHYASPPGWTRREHFGPDSLATWQGPAWADGTLPIFYIERRSNVDGDSAAGWSSTLQRQFTGRGMSPVTGRVITDALGKEWAEVEGTMLVPNSNLRSRLTTRMRSENHVAYTVGCTGNEAHAEEVIPLCRTFFEQIRF